MLHLTAVCESNQKICDLLTDLATFYWAHKKWPEFFAYRIAARKIAALQIAWESVTFKQCLQPSIRKQVEELIAKGDISNNPYVNPPTEEEYYHSQREFRQKVVAGGAVAGLFLVLGVRYWLKKK